MLNGLKRQLLASLFGVVLAASAQASWHYQTQAIMGTEIILHFWDENPDHAQKTAEQVFEEMHRIDRVFSPYKKNSELSALNRQAINGPMAVSEEMAMIIQKSLLISQLTHGAFDVTYASVGYLYHFPKKIKPSQGQIHAKLPAIDYRHVQFDAKAQAVTLLNRDVKLDFGGIVKGYAVDRAAMILTQNGIHSASISAGGDSRILGDKRGRPWSVGIKHPRGGAQSAVKLPLENTAMSTSGDYERFFIDQDSQQRIHHIINPTTGKPAQEVVSVTVFGRMGIDTDPLSTAVFILGVKQGLALINRLDGFDAVVIDHTGKMHYSKGLSHE